MERSSPTYETKARSQMTSLGPGAGTEAAGGRAPMTGKWNVTSSEDDFQNQESKEGRLKTKISDSKIRYDDMSQEMMINKETI